MLQSKAAVWYARPSASDTQEKLQLPHSAIEVGMAVQALPCVMHNFDLENRILETR